MLGPLSTKNLPTNRLPIGLNCEMLSIERCERVKICVTVIEIMDDDHMLLLLMRIMMIIKNVIVMYQCDVNYIAL